MTKKDNRGDKRENSGRHKKFSCKTKRIYMTVPEAKEKELKKKFEAIIDKLPERVKN